MPSHSKSGSPAPESLERKYEAGEPQLRNAMIFAISVAVMTVLCLVSSAMLIHFFARSRPMQPMQELGIIVSPDLKPLTRFPRPNLENDDGHAELSALLTRQNNELNSYGWVDRSNGIIRIPIERAMDLILQRGLPARTNAVSQTGPSALQLLQERPEQR
jgi:hypothetical protein